MPPVLTREQFDKELPFIRTFKVWVQISPSLQYNLLITKEQAIEMANAAFEVGNKLFAITNFKGILELSTTSQWYDKWVLEGKGI